MSNEKLKIKMTKRTILIIVICILLVLALVLGLVFGIKGCSSSSSSSSSEPTTSETSSSPSSSSESSSASSSEPGHTHTPGTPVKENEVNATCTVGGSYDLVTYCTSCTAKLNTEHKTTDPLGHDLVHHSAQSATCTEDGWNAYETCSRCDYTTYEKIDALGHDYDDSIAANVTYSWLDYATGLLQKSVKCSRDTTHDAQVTNVNSNLTVHTNDSDKGTVTVTNGYGLTTGESITVSATPASGFAFVGWYSDSGLTTKVSSDNPYSFSMTSGTFSLYAKYIVYNPAVEPFVLGDTIEFGLYPQSQVSSSLESALDSAKSASTITPDSNNWYLYEGNYYSEEGSNWYKCEPITWKILNSSTASTDGYYYIASEKVLDRFQYYTNQSNRNIGGTVYANNYQYSNARAWLNGYNGSSYGVTDYSGSGFYNTAFSYAPARDTIINTMNVDNSASSTYNPSNTYACDNTSDKVTLLSYQEVSHKFDSANARKAIVTDYAFAKGGLSKDALGNVDYFTRSPEYGFPNSYCCAWVVSKDGVLTSNSYVNGTRGARPVIQIAIPA